MARTHHTGLYMNPSKSRLLFLLAYLNRETDEEHPVTITEIVQCLNATDFTATRKTIAKDIDILIEHGIDVVCNKGRQNQYFIGDQIFELPELTLLTDAVQAARFISIERSKKMIAKLSGLTSRHQADTLNRQLYVDKHIKSVNENGLYTMDLLHAAIPVETIIERVYGLTLDFQYIRNNGRVLGETVFETSMIPIYERENGEGYKLILVEAGTVIIDASLVNNRGDGRFRYTCAHELAHWVIHKEFFTNLGETAAMTKLVKSSEADKTIEQRANRLASYLLMPKGTVKSAFYNMCRGNGDIVGSLAEVFCVSKEAMSYRIREMRLLS